MGKTNGSATRSGDPGSQDTPARASHEIGLTS